jgi:hypothetical protein
MLRVIVELHPHGRAEDKKTLAIMNIANTGQGSSELGHYEYCSFDERKKHDRLGFIKGFPRLKLTAWDLLYRILRKEYGHRNRPKKRKTLWSQVGPTGQ